MDLDELCAKLDNVHAMPSGRSARCPAHDDRVSSLMLNNGRDGGVVMKCHAGCSTKDVMAALGLDIRELMGVPKHVATYEYLRVDGSLAYSVERWTNPKTFRCVPGLPAPAERVLYQLPAIEWARLNGETVYIVEGEKDVDRLVSMGRVATCNVTGAGGWLPHYADMLRDCHCVVIADNDAPGRAHARLVAASVASTAATVSLVLPRFGKDVSELLDAGYTFDALEPLSESEDVGYVVAATVRTRAVRWAWSGYFALGKLSIVEGDPGDGKSILTLDLAARWSTGASMPDGSNGAGPWPIVLVSAEDDPDDTIVPRLVAAGGKLEVITMFTHGPTPDEPFEFATGLAAVERRVMETGARIVIFDPLTAFLSERTDSHNDASVRRALQPLRMLAARTGAAVIVVRHLNKGGSGTKAIYRGGGSIGFTGAARATFVVARDPDDQAARIFANVKTNLARTPASLRYVIETSPDGVPYVTWKGTADLDAQRILDGPDRERSAETENRALESSRRHYEAEFLMDVLADGPKTWNDIKEIAKSEGFSEHRLRDARASLGLVKIHGSDGARQVTWKLPDTAGPVADSRLPICEPVGIASTSDSIEPANGQTAEGHESLSDDSDDDKDQRLMDHALVCDVCGSETDVARYARPYWTVRCDSHNPFDYRGN